MFKTTKLVSDCKYTYDYDTNTLVRISTIDNNNMRCARHIAWLNSLFYTEYTDPDIINEWEDTTGMTRYTNAQELYAIGVNRLSVDYVVSLLNDIYERTQVIGGEDE